MSNPDVRDGKTAAHRVDAERRFRMLQRSLKRKWNEFLGLVHKKDRCVATRQPFAAIDRDLMFLDLVMRPMEAEMAVLAARLRQLDDKEGAV